MSDSPPPPIEHHGQGASWNDGRTAGEAPPNPSRELGNNLSSGADEHPASNDSSSRPGNDDASAGPADQLASEISTLRARSRDIRDERKLLRRNLKNAQRRRSRLVKASGALSDADVMMMLRMRGIRTPSAGGSSSTAGAAAQDGVTPVV